MVSIEALKYLNITKKVVKICIMEPKVMTAHEMGESHFAMRRLIADNLALQESDFQDKIAIFRADIIDMFRRCSVEGTDVWLIYKGVPGNIDDDDAEWWWENSEVLVTMNLCSDTTKVEPPLIRMYESTLSPGCMVTRDIVVDHMGDAQYFTDAVDIFDGQSSTERHGNGSYCTSFEQENGELYFINKKPYTPIVEVEAEIAGHVLITVPFGVFDRPLDREYALYEAQKLLMRISNEVPFSSGVG